MNPSTLANAVYGVTWRSVTDPPPLPRSRPAPPPRRPVGRLAAADVAEIRRQVASGGCSQRELAARYQVAEATIRKAVRGESWRSVTEPPPIPPGPPGLPPATTAETRASIRRFHTAGRKGAEIAQMLGISKATVSRVLKGADPGWLASTGC